MEMRRCREKLGLRRYWHLSDAAAEGGEGHGAEGRINLKKSQKPRSHWKSPLGNSRVSFRCGWASLPTTWRRALKCVLHKATTRGMHSSSKPLSQLCKETGRIASKRHRPDQAP